MIGTTEWEAAAYRRLLAWSTVSPSGCWLTGHSVSPDGYGRIAVKGRCTPTHRLAYAVAHGLSLVDLPSGPASENGRRAEIDHLCRVRSCFRPDHLEMVTRRENMLRGNTFQARNASKKACPRGHFLGGDNLRASDSKLGMRTCLLCDRASSRVSSAKRNGRILAFEDALAAVEAKYPDLLRRGA